MERVWKTYRRGKLRQLSGEKQYEGVFETMCFVIVVVDWSSKGTSLSAAIECISWRDVKPATPLAAGSSEMLAYGIPMKESKVGVSPKSSTRLTAVDEWSVWYRGWHTSRMSSIEGWGDGDTTDIFCAISNASSYLITMTTSRRGGSSVLLHASISF